MRDPLRIFHQMLHSFYQDSKRLESCQRSYRNLHDAYSELSSKFKALQSERQLTPTELADQVRRLAEKSHDAETYEKEMEKLYTYRENQTASLQRQHEMELASLKQQHEMELAKQKAEIADLRQQLAEKEVAVQLPSDPQPPDFFLEDSLAFRAQIKSKARTRTNPYI